MATINADDIASLGAKLDTLDLTDNETAALHALLTAALDDHDDVTGFAHRPGTTIEPDPYPTKAGFRDRFGAALSSGITLPDATKIMAGSGNGGI
ncbi:MAG TPA: hypothetical protein VK866_08220 [Acidimicrobiales bacterium]|nr:hypothetical protein [Acidimicrobiales bacterium]